MGMSPRNRLRVLLYHDIPTELQDRFAGQLRWLARSWKFVSPQQFEAMASGADPIIGFNLLLTFDDGFASNRVVAEHVLRPMGIKAVFFVISDLVGITDPVEARRFIVQNVFPKTSEHHVPRHLRNMSWPDLEALIEQGHIIGAHTRTHVRLADVTTERGLEAEIIDSADALERRLGTPVDHFAYTFGDRHSFTEQTAAVAKRRFRFIHTGMRGDNSGVCQHGIRRDAQTPADPNSLLGAFVEGFADFRYPTVMRES